MKLLFTGTDVLYLKCYPKTLKRRWIYIFFFRIIVRILDIVSEGHYAVSQRLIDELKKVGLRNKIELLEWKILHETKFNKIEHDGINILYRKFTTKRNKKFYDWLTSYDVFLKVKDFYKGVNFIELDDTMDIKQIFTIVDMYIRFNRWDGGDPPRLVRECINNNIPTYYTVGEPDLKGIIKFISENLKK